MGDELAAENRTSEMKAGGRNLPRKDRQAQESLSHMSAITDPKARWREVTGTVLKSEVKFDWEDYRPVVEYQYEVDGVSYRGDTIVVGPLVRFNWKGPATRVIERFPAGASVTVYVDPANPHRASLQPGVDRNLPLFLIIIGIFAVIFVGTLLRACGTP